MPRSLKVAVVQDSPVLFDRERTLDKVAELAERAAGGGARLVLFPEAFVSAYPRGMSFGCAVGARTPEGREEYRRYWESAVDIPGPALDRLSVIAREATIWLVIGVIEREGGTLYCSVLFISPAGELTGKRRKLMPTAAERLVWGQGDGSTLHAVETPHGRLGAAICWENYMPMLRMALYAEGVEIWCAPTADSRDSWIATIRHIACEGRCFVLSANQFVRREDWPQDLRATGTAEDVVLCSGGSAIVDPYGNLLAGPLRDEAMILTADLDLDEIPRAKLDFDAVGHYARPDIFELHVNREQRRAVTSG